MGFFLCTMIFCLQGAHDVKVFISNLISDFLFAGIVLVSNIKAIPQNGTQKSDESINENSLNPARNAGLESFVPLTKSGYKLAIRLASREDLREELTPLLLNELRNIKDVILVENDREADLIIPIAAIWVQKDNEDKTQSIISLCVNFLKPLDIDKIKPNIIPEKWEETNKLLQDTFVVVTTAVYTSSLKKLPELVKEIVNVMDRKILEIDRKRRRKL